MGAFVVIRPARIAVALLALVLSTLTVPASAAFAATVQVSMVDLQFQPRSITVNAGDTVVWTNTGAVGHTATASDGSWDSGNVAPGQSYSRTFDSPGTVSYYCKPHGTPDGSGMAGTVVVLASAAAPPAAPPAGSSGGPQAGPGEVASQAPERLPASGSAETPGLWMLFAAMAVALVMGGAVLRRRQTR